MQTNVRWGTLGIGLAMLLCCLVASAEESVSKVESLQGSVEAIGTDGTKRKLSLGNGLRSGERVQVGKDSRVSLRFSDGTFVQVGQNGRFMLDHYAFSKDPEESNFGMRILQGSFRVVTGLIAKRKPQAMSVGLTVATIGIRGTDFVGEVDETSAKVILLEPEDKDRKTAVEVSNKFGQVLIDTPGYGTEIPDQFSPPSPVRRMQLGQIQNLLRIMRPPTVPMPRGPR